MSLSDAELKCRLEGPVADAVAAMADGDGEHAGVDELIAYRQRDLPEARYRDLQNHLVACEDCLETLLELDEVVLPGEAAAAGTERPDLAAWDSFDGEVVRWVSSGGRGRSTPPVWMSALAASLLLAAMGLGLWALDRGRQLRELADRVALLSQPQPGAGIVELFAEGSRRNAGEDLEPPGASAARFQTLILHLTEPGRPLGTETSEASYEVEILDPRGATVWSQTGLSRSSLGTLRLGIAPGFLEPGRYRILLRSAGDSAEPAAAVYALTLRAP